ncbi:hypothetical protein HSR121_0763 [Halapricum desulfuricans]|uniref:Uncharacterized protein n=1 Tax=Halapricum desulfuricans TaxID=2841257 RepID=A0A897MXE6_9EURY|nr:hypothetical protein HSR121_0763 [Halapricum desulfuricans]
MVVLGNRFVHDRVFIMRNFISGSGLTRHWSSAPKAFHDARHPRHYRGFSTVLDRHVTAPLAPS